MIYRIALIVLILSLPLTLNAKRINWDRVYKVSVITLLTSTSYDAYTSHGLYERNPLLRDHNGNFGRKGLTVKLSLTGGLIGIQLITHKRISGRKALNGSLDTHINNLRNTQKVNSLVNLGASVIYTITSTHNLKQK